MWPRRESNADPGLRRPLYYPLYYEARLVDWLIRVLVNRVRFPNQPVNQLTNKLLYQSMGIGGKDLYGNGEQYYAKKLSYRNQSRRA